MRRQQVLDEVGPEILTLMAGWIKVGLNLEDVWRLLMSDVPFLAAAPFQPLRDEGVQALPVRQRFHLLFQGPSWGVVRAVLDLGQESGGQLGAMLESCAKVHKKRAQVVKKIETLTAEGRVSAWVVGLSPVGFLCGMALLSPDLVKPLFLTTSGRMLLGLAFFLSSIGIFLIYRMTRIDV